MKKLNLYAIVALAIVIVAFQSCKKDDELTRTDNTNTEAKAFNPKGIENMDEYLLGFMKKIKTATRDNETMTIEDAEWHLSACLNFQFCNANVEKSCIEYDTIFTTINVENGNITLAALNNTINDLSSEILSSYNSNDMDNRNILFIKPEIINENNRGNNTVRTIIAEYGDCEFGYYYFDNDSIPLSLFTQDTYQWDDAADTLEFYMNMFKKEKPTDPSLRIYYVITREECLDYITYPDRIYNAGYAPVDLSRECMAYYLDSYLGFIREFLYLGGPRNISLPNQREYYVSSDVVPQMGLLDRDITEDMPIYHLLFVYYGIPYVTEIPCPID